MVGSRLKQFYTLCWNLIKKVISLYHYYQISGFKNNLKLPYHRSKADEESCQGVHHNGVLKEDIGAGDQGFMFGYATGTSLIHSAAIFILCTYTVTAADRPVKSDHLLHLCFQGS